MRAVVVGAFYSCSGVVVPVDLSDASEGRIRAMKNYVVRGN
jgi:hypothetical protein